MVIVAGTGTIGATGRGGGYIDPVMPSNFLLVWLIHYIENLPAGGIHKPKLYSSSVFPSYSALTVYFGCPHIPSQPLTFDHHQVDISTSSFRNLVRPCRTMIIRPRLPK